MSDSKKQILDWQEKVKNHYGSEAEMYQYLFQTMDNFYYRYLETSESQNLKTHELENHIWGAKSFESSMVEALKTTNPDAKKGIMELARTIPKAKKPMVRYALFSNVKLLTSDKGQIEITSEINWDFPDFKDQSKQVQKTILFNYQELAEFRKNLALKLEEACELFN